MLLSLSLPFALSLHDRSEAANSDQSELDALMKYARVEKDPEIALELWDEIIAEDGGVVWESLVSRGNINLLQNRWEDAIADFTRAVPLLREQRGGKRAFLPSGDTVAVEEVQEALALECIGLAKGQLGDWDGALDSLERALGRVGTAGSTGATIPEGTPYSGLKGGAPSLGQRIELSSALARFESGDVKGAAAALQLIDKGPDPDGFPQFWDARAALAGALYAAGDRAAAEAEWEQLCRPAPPPPPSTPTNQLFAGVNKAAQTMLKAEGMMTDKNCEDYETGLYLPCDNAGIPGLGGSSSPCVLYTPDEVRARMWPAAFRSAFLEFRNKETA